MEILKQRRTIRKYQQKDISSDLLNDLLDSAFRSLYSRKYAGVQCNCNA